jgi:hypothetical protein
MPVSESRAGSRYTPPLPSGGPAPPMGVPPPPRPQVEPK